MKVGDQGSGGQRTALPRRLVGRFVPGAGLVALLNLLILAGVGLLAFQVERAELRSARQDQREAVTRQAALLASRLETEVNSAFYLVTGLAGYLGIRGELTQEEYTQVCRQMFLAKPELVNISAAPGLVVRHVYPLEGNEMVIGLDYRELPEQLPGVLEVMETRQPLIAGPVQLVQGGEAIIGRIPVIDRRPGREGEFWGIVSTPLRMEALYEQAGVSESVHGLAVALRGKDGRGSEGAVFLGDPVMYRGEGVLFPVNLVSGSWLLAAEPADGWVRTSPYRNTIYAVAALLAILLVVLNSLAAIHLRRVEHARKKEAEAQLSKERFLANMSHEIRTPLNGICGLAELISSGAEDDVTREGAEIIQKSSHALTRLLGDVLTVCDMEYGRAEPRVEAVRLVPLLDEVAAPLRPEIEKKGLELSYADIPEDCRTVPSDPVLLRQILWQLLANAVKFTERGKVEVRVRRREGRICIEVSDTGVGIREDYLEKIYDIFSQEDETHTRKFYGAGLGLPIVKRSVELLGGTVSVKSEKGSGARFTVELPLREAGGGAPVQSGR